VVGVVQEARWRGGDGAQVSCALLLGSPSPVAVDVAQGRATVPASPDTLLPALCAGPH
jgi:hypothetical protein